MLLFISIFLCFCCILDYTDLNIQYKKLVLFFILGVFIFVAGGRFEFANGGDWFIYKEYFVAAPVFGNFDDLVPLNLFFEPGFFVLTCFIKLFSDNFLFYFFSIETISVALLYFSLKEYTRYPLVSLLLYFPLFFLSLDLIAIRSLLAVQLFLYSIQFIVDKKLLKYCLILLIATLIHISAIVLFPMYFILNKFYSKKFVVIVIFIGFIFLLLKIDILTFISQYIPIAKITEYSDMASENGGSGLSIKHIEFIFIVSLFIAFRQNLQSIYQKYFNVFFNMFFFYGIITFYFFGIPSFAGRLKFFFLPSAFILLPYLLYFTIKNKTIFVTYFMLGLYSLAMIIYMMYLREDGGIFLEYKNYFLVSK